MLQRRVYAPELRMALGWGPSWFRMQKKRGLIPPGNTDPGGRREWWHEPVAQKIVEDLNKAAV
jgi:hypothetical protein